MLDAHIVMRYRCFVRHAAHNNHRTTIMAYEAVKTKDKYWEQLNLGLFWCVYLMHVDRRIVAWCVSEAEAKNIAFVLNRQIGITDAA